MKFSDQSQAILLQEGSAALALRRGFSTRTLRRRLEVEGHTLRGFTDTLRVRETVRLLTEGRSPTQVAEEVGFSTPQAFCRFCYRLFGAPPSEIRRKFLAGGTPSPLSAPQDPSRPAAGP